jgi:hypothetical protein
MSDPPMPASMGTPFTLHLLVQVRVGPVSIGLYLVVNPSMLPHECAHAFHINKTMLAAQNIDTRLQLDALGMQLDFSATVDGTINNWFRFFYDSWFDFSRLTILSFHNVKKDIVPDMMEADDPAILLPVQDGLLTNCRKKDVKFVRVQLMLDYSPLVNVTTQAGPTILRAEYYIELSQTLQQLFNGQQTPYNLLTFHGPGNLQTLSSTEIQAQILNVTFQDGPVDLQPARFNLSSARTDSTELRSETEAKILHLSFSTVCNALFLELCPGYSSQPHAAIDHICQIHSDRDRNQVASTVQAYFQQLMGVARPFSSHREFPMSMCTQFQEGLNPRLQTGFHWYFPQHSGVQLLNATHQRKTLQATLQAAQQAEDDLHAVQHVAQEGVGMSQAFHASATGGLQTAASAFPSQAEKTLMRYSSDSNSPAASHSPHGGGTQHPWSCFGCGGPHPYSELCTNEGHVVICPNRDIPGVRENAARNIEKMCKNHKKRHNPNSKRKNLRTVNLSNFDEQGKRRITEQVLVSMTGKIVGKHKSVALLVSTPRSPSKQDRGRGPGPGGGVVLIADVVVLAGGLRLKRAMPISIQSTLPHITIQFGANLDCPNCPLIRCAINLCTTLTTGNFHFFALVAKRFPHCVAKMYTPDDYAPIVLSGIVQLNEESVTTELEVGFLFHLPYRTREGNTASLMVATGPNVSVNTIIGLPFMKAMGMILDLVDEVMDCRYLNCLPFPVDFCRTSNHMPVMDEPSNTPANHATSHLQIIQEVENIKRYIDAKVLAGSMTLTPKTLAVHFGLKSPVCTVVDINSSSAYSDNAFVKMKIVPKGMITVI